MTILKFSTDTFDQDNTFTIEVQGFKRMTNIRASLHLDYHKRGDGIIWAMKSSAVLKAEYTDKDYEESARLRSMTPIRHGDIVEIEGKQYKTRVLGNFSNCAIFDPI